MQRRHLLAASAALAGSAVSRHARAQQSGFPDRPVRLVVPFPPGGSYDVLARILTRPLQEAWGQSVIVDNRPGAGGNIGADVVAKAAPDGTTLLLWGDGLLINQALFRSRPWDALRDFAAVGRIVESPQMLVSAPGSGIDSLGDLLALARKRDVTYGTAGIGTPNHLIGELLRAQTHTRLVHIPYRGGAPAIADLLGGRLDAVCTGVPTCLPFLRDNRIKALAVSSTQRFSSLPDVPTLAETVPGVAIDSWYGVLAPAHTSPAILQQISRTMAAVVARPDIAQALQEQGLAPAATDPAGLTALLTRDAPRWAQLVAISGATVE